MRPGSTGLACPPSVPVIGPRFVDRGWPGWKRRGRRCGWPTAVHAGGADDPDTPARRLYDIDRDVVHAVIPPDPCCCSTLPQRDRACWRGAPRPVREDNPAVVRGRGTGRGRALVEWASRVLRRARSRHGQHPARGPARGGRLSSGLTGLPAERARRGASPWVDTSGAFLRPSVFPAPAQWRRAAPAADSGKIADRLDDGGRTAVGGDAGSRPARCDGLAGAVDAGLPIAGVLTDSGPSPTCPVEDGDMDGPGRTTAAVPAVPGLVEDRMAAHQP